jgi:hypothetical protein
MIANTERYPALHATPELVGRDNVLRQCNDIFTKAKSDPRLVFLSGAGGIGKTRLLRKILEITRALPDYRVAGDLVDFYDVFLHTPVELADAIFKVLTPPSSGFDAYQVAGQALTRARLGGYAIDLDKLRNDVLAQFEQDLIKLSESQRIVIVLDTVERIVYGMPGETGEPPVAESWTWLIECLPKWKNVIIFVAGREGARSAIERIKARHSNLVQEIPIDPFSEEESLKYFAQVSELLKNGGNYQLSERLENMPESMKRGAHVYSQGRPILLSLLVDYLSFPGEGDLLEMLRGSLPKKPGDNETRHYEALIFDRLRNSELGDTLIALGRIPKGADEKLLASLLDITVPEARKRLQEVQSLSVVKIRRKDNQQLFFLHDEMYALLQRNVYDGAFDAEKQGPAFRAIKEYYQEQRDASIQRLNILYAPVEERGHTDLDLKELGKAHADHQALLTDTVYYYIREDLGRGFRAYIRYSQEAIFARDVLMDLQLQAELLSYLSAPPRKILELDDDVSVEMILACLRIRSVARLWALGKYQEGLGIAHRDIQALGQIWSRFPILLAALHAWTASLHVLRSTKDDLDEAEIHLKNVYSLLPAEEISEPITDISNQTLLWYKKSVMAIAHRVYGYLNRVRGFMKDAEVEYQNAAVILRELDLLAEMAVVSNDMGFAQAELGKYHDGRANVLDALELRRKLGRRVSVAMSLNTLASVDVREGRYREARQNSERALSICRAFSQPRGIGLALITLAEATRRYAGSEPLLSSEERIDLLRRARDHAREAYSLFKNTPEISRLVEANIEIGCACRDLVWWLKTTPWPGDAVDRTYNESLDALKMAADLAREHDLTYRYVDALVNQAWLEYYMFSLDKKTYEVSRVIALMAEIENSFPSNKEIEKQPQVWAQKGKLYVLKGHLCRHSVGYLRQEKPKGLPTEIEAALKQMAENYALALEYSSKFADDYQGIRQAKDSIFERLKDLNAAEMNVIREQIRALYPKGSTIETFLTNRALWQTR